MMRKLKLMILGMMMSFGVNASELEAVFDWDSMCAAFNERFPHYHDRFNQTAFSNKLYDFMLEHIIAHGGNINSKIKTFNDRDSTLLINAAEGQGSTDKFLELVEQGADLNITVPICPAGVIVYHNVLDVLVMRKKSDIISSLIERNIINVDHFCDDSQKTMLYQACRENIPLFQTLISFGANVNSKDIDGVSILHRASCCMSKECVLTLIAKGADINAEATGENFKFHTPLTLGYRYYLDDPKYHPILLTLIRYGAELLEQEYINEDDPVDNNIHYTYAYVRGQQILDRMAADADFRAMVENAQRQYANWGRRKDFGFFASGFNKLSFEQNTIEKYYISKVFREPLLNQLIASYL